MSNVPDWILRNKTEPAVAVTAPPRREHPSPLQPDPDQLRELNRSHGMQHGLATMLAGTRDGRLNSPADLERFAAIVDAWALEDAAEGWRLPPEPGDDALRGPAAYTGQPDMTWEAGPPERDLSPWTGAGLSADQEAAFRSGFWEAVSAFAESFDAEIWPWLSYTLRTIADDHYQHAAFPLRHNATSITVGEASASMDRTGAAVRKMADYWRSAGDDHPPASEYDKMLDRLLYVRDSDAASTDRERHHESEDDSMSQSQRTEVELLAAVDGLSDSAMVALRKRLDAETESRISMDVGASKADDTRPARSDAITVPDSLLVMPGFVDAYVEHCRAHAPVFNHRIAFWGGLAALSFLTGRKWQSETGLRTNLYTVALAASGAGKDFTRKLNQELLLEAGFFGAVVREIASGQGLEDSLVACPTKLLLMDEADSLLASIRGEQAKDGNPYTEKLLLELYTSAASVFETRQKAGATPATIYCPHLVLQGCAVTGFFFSGISEKMADGGLLARMLIVNAEEPRHKRMVKAVPPPPDLVERAKWFRTFAPGGDMAEVTPEAVTVPCTPEARKCLEAFLRRESKESERAARDDNHLAASLWNRSTEQAIKLSVLAALSADPEAPTVTGEQTEWATAFAVEHARQVIALTDRYGQAGYFEKAAARIIRKVQQDKRVPRSVLLKHAKTSAREFDQVMSTLIQRGDVQAIEVGENLGARRTDYVPAS